MEVLNFWSEVDGAPPHTSEMVAHAALALLDELDAAGVPVDEESALEGDINSSDIDGSE